MPTEIADAFSVVTPPKPAPPVAEPPPKPSGKGEDISAVFARQPKPKSVAAKATEAAKKAGGLAGHAAMATWTASVRPYLDDMNKWAMDYSHALNEDIHAYPEGTGDQLLQSLKTVNDAIAYVSGPIMSPVYTGVINPLKAGIDRLGKLIEKHAAEDTYNAQARREGKTGPEFPKGIDWEVHKRDVKTAVDGLKDLSESVINVGVGFVAGPVGKKLGLESKPVLDEKAKSNARTALRDMRSAVGDRPPPPKLEPVTLSLDKTMGFGKISENVGEGLKALPEGSTRSTAAILDEMIPHAEGYAKGFLQKLSEHIDPTVPVKFKAVAGGKDSMSGAYIPGLHQIEIKAGSADIVHTTVHEMVHAATINMMDSLIESDLKSMKEELGRELTGPEKLNAISKPRSPVLQELDKIINEARVRAQKAGRTFYGLKPIDPKSGSPSFSRMSPRYEFVAEVFTNPEMQEFLANSEKYASAGYKFKNMLDQFGYMVGKHLGMKMPHETRLLNQSLRVGSRLIEMQGSEKPRSGRDIAAIVGKTDSGEIITRGDMDAATVVAGKMTDAKALKRAKDALTISVEQLLRGISPESLSKNAKLAGSVIASRITEMMQKEAMWRGGSKTRLRFWRARPDMVEEFRNGFERGATFSDSLLERTKKIYKEWNQRIFENEKKLGFDYEPQDNYLFHAFEDKEGVANYFTRKYGSKWGDPGFIKDRTFAMYNEAIAAGFKPRFENPEDLMLARQHASDLAEMHIGIMNDLASYGLAIRKIKGKTEIVKDIDSEGKVSLSLKKTEGNKQPEGSVRWRAPNGDVFWVDKHADAILQNAFKSKSFWEDRGASGVIFRGMMGVKNALVPIRLALSLFHPLHVIGIDAAAGITRSMVGMLSGSTPIHVGLTDMLKDGLLYRSLYENPKAGWRVMQALKGKIPKEALNPADTEALKTLTEMGLPIEMSSQYRSNARQNFSNALVDTMADFRQRKLLGVAGDVTRATWHLPWAFISAMSKPIFEDWIPMLKAASALKDAKGLLARNPHLTENDADRLLAMRRLGKSVENRYGEMAYNTLFWKRWIKDLAVLDTLSLGWQLGFIREYGGGALDVGQFVRSGDKLQRIKMGQMDRPIFVGAYTTLGAGVAGLMTWGMTGEPPTSLLDYISPRTGEKNPDGSDQRVSTMFYSREFASLYKHMQNEGVVSGLKEAVLNKGSGLFGLMHEWATGVNGFDQHIREPSDPAFTQLEQTIAYSLSDLEPISMKALQQNITDKPVKAGALSVLGFTPAPKYLTETKTEALVKSAFSTYVAGKETPFEKAEYSREYTQLREAYQTGSEKFGDLLDKMTEKYELSGKDQRRMMKSLNSEIPATVRMFMRLDWQQQKKLLDQMTPEERDIYLPHSNREHVRNTYEAPE